MITFPCARCAKQLQTRPELVGKKVKCPHCGQEVVVPATGSGKATTPTAGSPPAQSTPVRSPPSAAPAPLLPQSAAAASGAAIAAEELRRLIQDNKPVPHHEGCLITGDVNLADLKYEHKLALHNCTFKGHVDATDSHFLKTLDLSGCTFEQGISLAGASLDHLIAPKCKFMGPFDASEVCFGESVDLSESVFEEGIKFPVTRIAGNLLLTDAAIRGPEACFELVSIAGNLLALGLQTQTTLNFTNASVRGRTDFSPTDQPMRCTSGLLLGGATLSGGVILKKAELTGFLKLTKATILGDLRCEDLRLQNAQKKGEPEKWSGLGDLSGLTVSGQVSFDRSHIEGNLDLQATEIRGGFFCQQAHIAGCLKLPGAKISLAASFAGSHFGQRLSFPTAVVDGSLRLDGIFVGYPPPEKGAAGGESSKPEEDSQAADGTGDVEAHGLSVTHDVWVLGARIRRDLRLDGAHLGGNLLLNGSQIHGNVSLANTETQQNMHFSSSLPDHKAQVGGTLRLSGAKIGGKLHLDGIDIKHDLNLSSVVIKEGLRLHAEEHGHIGPEKRDLLTSKIGGNVDLSTATVTGGVWLNQVEIRGDLNLTAGSIKGGLRAQEAVVSGKTDLSSADVTGGIHFTNARLGPQLKGVGAVVAGGLKCSGLQVSTEVDFSGSQLAGVVEFQGAQVGGLFQFRDATIKGELVCNAMTACSVLLTGLKVTGSVDFGGAQIVAKLSLDRARIDGRLKFRFRAEPLTRIGNEAAVPLEDGKAALDLKACFAHVANFDDHNPKECRRLHMDTRKLPVIAMQGFRFDDLIVPGDDYVGFLGQTEFGQTNYVLMEKWLSNQGNSAQAELVFLAKRDRANQEANRGWNPALRLLNPLWRLASKCFLLLAFRSFSWALIGLVVVGITCWVFSTPGSVRAKQSPWGEPGPREWGPVKSMRMACHIHFPGAPSAFWTSGSRPTPRSGAGNSPLAQTSR